MMPDRRGAERPRVRVVAVAPALRPDFIFFERLLPGLDGIETARVIAADGPVPIILLASYAGAELVIVRRPCAHVEDHLRSAFEGRDDIVVIQDRRQPKGAKPSGEAVG